MCAYHKQRSESEIRRQLSNIITFDVHDPVVVNANITVMNVEVSVDGKYAKVFVSVLDEDKEAQKKVLKALERAQGFMRTKLAQKIKMRHAPELHFKLDDSITKSFRIQKILRKIETKEV